MRSPRFPLLLMTVAALSLALPGSGVGQDVLAAGDRIRVKPLIRPTDRVTATFVSLHRDTMTLEDGNALRRLALTDIKTLEVGTGEKSHLMGTILGAFTGALVGMLVGMGIDRATDDYCYEYCGLEGAFYGFLAGGVAGGFAGYHLLPKETWVDVEIDGLRVSLEPAAIRFYVGR